MKILLLGANGFLGNNIKKKLLQLKGHELLFHYRTDPKLQESENKICIDLSNKFIDSSLIKKIRIDLIINCVWFKQGGDNNHNHKLQYKNITIAENIMSLVSTTKAKSLLTFGSIHELEGICGEFQNLNKYSETKKNVRNIFESYCYENQISLNYIFLPNLFGMGDKSNNFINRITNKLILGEEIQLNSNGKITEFIDVEIMSDYLVKNFLEFYNISFSYISLDNARKIEEFLKIMHEILKSKSRLLIKYSNEPYKDFMDCLDENKISYFKQNNSPFLDQYKKFIRFE